MFPQPRWILCLPLLMACSSNELLEVRMLPYRVAIAPITPPIVGTVSSGELPGKETELKLDINLGRVEDAVVAALGEYCFARVEILEPESAEAFDYERQVLESARASNADLVVELRLRYDPEIYREPAGTYWLGVPLHLFAWPSSWYLDDNGYHADVELTTTVYDRNALEAGGLSLGDPAAHVVTASARFAGTDLDFVDRTSGFKNYLPGLLIPGNFLSHETEDVREAVTQAVIDQLVHQVVNGLQSRRDDLVHADWIAPFFLEPDEITVKRDAGDVVVTGQVHLQASSRVRKMERIKFSAGGETVLVQPTIEAEDEAGITTYSFEARVPSEPEAMTLSIRCEAGSRDVYARSYTFDIPRT